MLAPRRAPVFAILLLVPALMTAQQARIVVHVVHDTTAIAGAVVRAGAVSATTDAIGDATLQVEPGRVTVVVSKIGFRPDTTALLVRADMDTTLTIHLLEQLSTVAPIFVTSTRAERRLEEEPLRIEVLGGDDVGEKSEMRPADSRTLLSEMSGVRVQSLSTLGAASVRIQGLPGRYTAVLDDGLPLYGGQASGFTLVDVVPLDLRQAEVIKGAASALYGPQALGGVVDLISRRPPDTSQALVSQSVPTSTDAMAFIARPIARNASATVLGGVHRQDARDEDHDGWIDIAGVRRAELRPRVFLDDSAGHTLMVTAGAFGEDRSAGTIGVPKIGPGVSFPDSLSTRHVDAGVVGHWRASGARSFTVRASATDEEHRHRFGDVTEPDTRRTAFAEATATQSDAHNVLIAGGALLADSYSSGAVPRFNARYSTPGLLVQDTYSAVGSLAATVNGRCDWSNIYGTICTPRLSVLARAGSSLSARLSGGSGWFAPRPLTDETETFGLTRVTIPRGLVAERGRTASVDVTATRGPLEVNGTLFANRVANPVGLQPATGDTTGAVNLVNATGPLNVHGGELFAVFNADPVIATAYYAAMRSREVSAETGRTREAPMTPRQSAGLDFAVDDDESGAYAAVEVFYTGRQSLEDDPYASVGRPFTTVGVLLADRWKSLTVFLNGEDLTGVRQSAWEPIGRSRVGPGGAWTVEPWAPTEGRRFNLGVKRAW
jgi:outer membrane receptor for ferrienterochelin and colicins